MANQTVTTGTPASPINYDDASISGLLNGETLTINGGAVRVDADVRHNQQAAVFGAVTLSATLGGSFVIDGSLVWELPFSASTGAVPTQGALGTNGVTGGTSGATGELTRVWATGSLDPAEAAAAMPATGFIKLRSKTGTFQNGETITLPGGATITASGAGKRSWIHVVGRESSVITIPRLGNFAITGDWYDLGTTNGLDDQTIQFPVADECPALQVETAPGSGIYEWWRNAGRRWVGHVQLQGQSPVNMTETVNIAPPPAYSDPAGFLHTMRRLRETATTAIHVTASSLGASTVEAGIYTLRTYVQKDGRRYGFVQIASGVANADRYGVIIDFDTAGAVVATPTVGSPLNTSNTVTAVGGGIYLVELTINLVSTATSTLTGTVGASDSATPTLVNGIPSYAGNVTQGIWYTELQLIAPSSIQYVNSTDERGKFFFSNPQTGSIIFAQRTGRTAGLKPPSGCKIRIPNVILSNAPTVSYSINSVQTPGSGPGRYGFSTLSAGAISISHVSMNWYQGIASAFSVDLRNSALVGWASSGAAGVQVYENLGIGISRDNATSGFFNLANSPSGITLTDIWQVRDQIGLAGITLSASANIIATRVRADAFGNSQGRISRMGTLGAGFNVANCDNVLLDDCTAIGSGFNVSSSTNVEIRNPKYAERITGTTETADNGTAITITTACTDVLIDGFSLLPGIPNIHPYAQILAVSSNCNRIKTRNIGTPTAPLNGGSANQMRNAIRFGGTVFNSEARRIYTENLGTVAVVHTATNQNIRLYNVWGDGDDAMSSVLGFDVLAQGCRWANNHTVQNATYGVHWEDAFTSATSGRITIFGNEPLPSTSGQCVASFGLNAGFTSAGNAAMPNVDDSITWTMPYYALGHTGIAQFTYGASATETWLCTGTNPQNFEYEYQIDAGGGTFSAWKWLLSNGRQSAGGTGGTSTVTVNSADVAAMTRKPAIGDYISSSNARIPAGTTITGVSGAGNNVLTLSASFTSTMSASERLFFWKDIALESISPTTGYKLKVKARVNAANATNLFSFLRIPFDTTALAQQEQYPLPTTQAEAGVFGVQAGSRIQVYNVTTSTEVANEVLAGSSWSLLYDEGTSFTDGDTVRVRIRKPGKLPYQTLAIASENGWGVLVSQVEDVIYGGSTPANVTVDYINQKIRATGTRASFNATEIVDIIRVAEATEDGIRLDEFANISGATELSASIYTAVTVELLGWQVSWASGSVAQAILAGGNIVGGISGDPVEDVVGGPQVTIRQSADSTVVSVGSGVLPADITAIAAAVRAELGVEMARIDVAVSTRNATAPDNAGIAAIKVKTDNLPADPASNTQVGTRLAANAYTAAPTASDTATAVLAAAQAAPIHADARKMNDTTIQGTGIASDLWRGAP